MREVIGCGVPRSGSTLVWQVLKICLPDYRVTKLHPCSQAISDTGQYIVGSIRNPYDIIASRFRARVANDNSDGAQEHVAGTLKGLREDLHMTRANFDELKRLRKRFKGRIVVLRYEDFVGYFSAIFGPVSELLKIAIPHELRARAKREHSWDANLKRTLALAPGTARDSRMGLAHLGTGCIIQPGMWKTIVPVWGHASVRKCCSSLCAEWGYEDQ